MLSLGLFLICATTDANATNKLCEKFLLSSQTKMPAGSIAYHGTGIASIAHLLKTGFLLTSESQSDGVKNGTKGLYVAAVASKFPNKPAFYDETYPHGVGGFFSDEKAKQAAASYATGIAGASAFLEKLGLPYTSIASLYARLIVEEGPDSDNVLELNHCYPGLEDRDLRPAIKEARRHFGFLVGINRKALGKYKWNSSEYDGGVFFYLPNGFEAEDINFIQALGSEEEAFLESVLRK